MHLQRSPEVFQDFVLVRELVSMTGVFYVSKAGQPRSIWAEFVPNRPHVDQIGQIWADVGLILTKIGHSWSTSGRMWQHQPDLATLGQSQANSGPGQIRRSGDLANVGQMWSIPGELRPSLGQALP